MPVQAAELERSIPSAAAIDETSEPSFPVPTRWSKFVSFDGRVSARTLHQRPDRYRHLEVPQGSRPRIARGGGFSYVGASFGAGVLVQEMTLFSRILAFDPVERLVRVESGVRVGDLLAWATRRNLYLPVVPGYPAITIGGCIAADVHGKNPRLDGTFREWVSAITLYHPDRGFLHVSPDSSGDLFEATCGGLGLTGIIVDATVRLVPLPAPSLRLSSVSVKSLEHAAEYVLNSSAPFCYTWHGGTLNPGTTNEGLAFFGEWEAAGMARAAPRVRTQLTSDNRAGLPFCLWNRSTAAMANAVFRFANRARREARIVSVLESCFPFERQQMYHRLFGRRGFGEMQLLVPSADFGRFVGRLGDIVRRHRPTITFMSIKAFRGSSKALSQSGEGLILAIDFARSAEAEAFEASMDGLILETGAQPNVSKDSRISASVVRQSLPNYVSFVSNVHRFDPGRLFQSELAKRLEI